MLKPFWRNRESTDDWQMMPQRLFCFGRLAEREFWLYIRLNPQGGSSVEVAHLFGDGRDDSMAFTMEVFSRLAPFDDSSEIACMG